MRGLYDLSQEDLALLLHDEPAYRVRQVWHGLYQTLSLPSELTELPKPLRARLRDKAALQPSLRLARQSESGDAMTLKWLWSLYDGRKIETVLMHYPDRSTVCVSSQAGCAMGCGFCATGQAGFERNLTAGEIVEQVVRAKRVARHARGADTTRSESLNVVFMGMGEPLANYERVWAAVERLHHDMGISARNLTLSTVGIIPGIRRLAVEALPVNLAVSLHAANDDLRDALVPINRRYPLAELADACRDYVEAKSRRLSFEWALIDGVNDRPSDARELADYVAPLRAHVNLIPLNPTPGYLTRGSARQVVEDFRDRLRALGVNATVRQNRGTDIAAACGQLAALARQG